TTWECPRGNPGEGQGRELRPPPGRLVAIGPRRPRPFPGRSVDWDRGTGRGPVPAASAPAARFTPRHGSSASEVSPLGLLFDRRQKLVNHCTEVTETECLPCSSSEFLATWNREKHCHQHKYCDPNLGLQVQREGTSKTDTTCVCSEGHHCTNSACESCTLHSLCFPGLGVKQMATEVSDTICEPCPVGFFSNVSSASEKCQPWTSCESKGLVEQRAGTNKTDVVCGKSQRMGPSSRLGGWGTEGVMGGSPGSTGRERGRGGEARGGGGLESWWPSSATLSVEPGKVTFPLCTSVSSSVKWDTTTSLKGWCNGLGWVLALSSLFCRPA
uniref:Tumor necrosis factor receptor superfamily member 5 n=1 Tax=Sus scrofa TaxID=9823 RepID=A0A8D0NAD6_PIG